MIGIVRNLLAVMTDDKLRLTLQINARQTALQFTPRLIADRWGLMLLWQYMLQHWWAGAQYGLAAYTTALVCILYILAELQQYRTGATSMHSNQVAL